MATTHFEDFTNGQVIELGSVTLTQEAIIDFATQFDPQPFHTDPVAAVESARLNHGRRGRTGARRPRVTAETQVVHWRRGWWGRRVLQREGRLVFRQDG